MSDLLETLNKEQREAVEEISEPVLILAGAGSGKTRVITYKIAYLVEKGISPFSILAITFTKKAAEEMKNRVENLIKRDVSSLWVSTFHAVCARILRYDGEAINIKSNFEILDEVDQKTLLKKIIKEYNLDTDKYKPKFFAYIINKARDHNKDIYDFLQEEYPDNEFAYAFEIIRDYEEAKKNSNVLDFGDLLYKTVELLKEKQEIREKYREKFEYILVDEFQDTNTIQYEFVKLLASGKNNISVVGDDDQSIYSFRGTSIENILYRFLVDFQNARIIKLERNYRSTKNILNLANKIILQTPNRHEKKLWTENQAGPEIQIVQTTNEYIEAKYCAETILSYLDRGYNFSEMAIFYRTNAQSRVIEEILMQYKIPYIIVKGLSFYNRKEIKDILSYLKLLGNPYDMLSLDRVINVPKRGIGKTTVNKIFKFFKENNINDWIAGLSLIDEIENLSAGAKKKINNFYEMLLDIKSMIQDMKLENIIKLILERTDYVNQEIDKYERSIYADKSENIEELKNFAIKFTEDNNNIKGEEAILLLSETIGLSRDIDYVEEDNRVNIMTIHSAKGLEFQVVFLIGAEDGLLPHYNAVYESFNTDEERRLLYVAITRAKTYLNIIYCRQRRIFGYIDENRKLSEFLRNIV